MTDADSTAASTVDINGPGNPALQAVLGVVFLTIAAGLVLMGWGSVPVDPATEEPSYSGAFALTIAMALLGALLLAFAAMQVSALTYATWIEVRALRTELATLRGRAGDVRPAVTDESGPTG